MKLPFAQMISRFVERPVATVAAGDTKPGQARPLASLLTGASLGTGLQLAVTLVAVSTTQVAPGTLPPGAQTPVSQAVERVASPAVPGVVENGGHARLPGVTPVVLAGDPRVACQALTGLDPEESAVLQLGSDIGVTNFTMPRAIDQAMATHILTHRALRACADPDRETRIESRSVRLSREGVYQDAGWALDAIAEFGPDRAVPAIRALADLRAMTVGLSLGEARASTAPVQAGMDNVLLSTSGSALNEIADRAHEFARAAGMPDRSGGRDMPAHEWMLQDLRERHAISSPLEAAKLVRAAMDTRISLDQGQVFVVLSPELSQERYDATRLAMANLDFTPDMTTAPQVRDVPPSYVGNSYPPAARGTAPETPENGNAGPGRRL